MRVIPKYQEGDKINYLSPHNKTKLLKKAGRYQMGGLIDTIDAKLDSLGTLGRLGVELLDPTGITGYKYLKDSYNEFMGDKSLKNAGKVGLAILGAFPVIGSLGKAGKVARAVDKIDDVSDARKALKLKDFQKATDLSKEESIALKNQVLESFTVHYTGKKHSVSEIVDSKGEINVEKLKSILKEIETNLTTSEGTKLTSLENVTSLDKRHIETNTIDKLSHTLAVGKSAQNLPTPLGISKQDQVFTALMHDIGNMINTNEHLHGPIGAKILKEVFPDINQELLNNVAGHMARNMRSSTQKALKIADIADGRNYLEFFKKIVIPKDIKALENQATMLKKELSSLPEASGKYKYLDRRLKTLEEEKGKLEKALAEVDNIPENEEDKVKHFKKFWEEVLKWPNAKSWVYKSTDSFVPVGNLNTAAYNAGILKRRILTADTQLLYSVNKDGTLKVMTDVNGSPLINHAGTVRTYDTLPEEMRIAMERSGDARELKLGSKNPGIPLYDHSEFKNLAQQYLGSNEIVALREAIERERGLNGALSPRGKELSHILLNVKWAATHDMEGIVSVGGRTAGKEGSLLEVTRWTPGQLSVVVDNYKRGYRGKVSPVIKGQGNYAGRIGQGYQTNGNNFGGSLYVTNSPKIGVRYADLRVGYENLGELIKDLSPEQQARATDIVKEILAFNKQNNIKQGNLIKNVMGTKYKSGTYEDLPSELYEEINKDKLQWLISKYDELQHIIGNKGMGLGGTRRGVAFLSDNALVQNWNQRTYKAWLPTDRILNKYFNRSYNNHNRFVEFANQLRFKQGITTNIGETFKLAHEKGAPYGIDFMLRPQDFEVARYKAGSKLLKRTIN